MAILSALSQASDSLSSRFQSLALLLLRLYVAGVFLKSGVQKLNHWESTLFLFQYEYNVPLLPPNIAAMLGTGAELLLPVLLIIGLLSRWAALGLFVFNIVAVVSYSALSVGKWSLITAFGFLPVGIGFPTKGFEDHVVWGVMLLVVFAFGAGRIGVDHWLAGRGESYALLIK